MWKCVFNGWYPATVKWSCTLTKKAAATVSQRSGSFSDGGHSTPWIFYDGGFNAYCVTAIAHYANGSAANRDDKCAFAGT